MILATTAQIAGCSTNMIQPFLYKWTEISTGKWYIGSRTAKKCHPDDGYLCSSKIVKPLIIANPLDWRREILCIGPHQYIRDLEVKYLHALDAMRDPMSYNKSNGAKSFVGGPKSPETREKLSAAAKGMKRAPFSQDHKDKISAGQRGKKRGPISQETKEKIREIKLNKYNGMYCGNISRLSDKKELTKKQYRQYITRCMDVKLRDK